MKYLCLMLITFFLFPILVIAQSDDLAPINTLLNQAEIALDEGNLATAQGLIIGANLLITKDMMTVCPVLESVKSLLDQASIMPDIERTRATLVSARALIDTCTAPAPEIPQNTAIPTNPNAISAQNITQVTQLSQIGNGYVNSIVYSPTGDTFAVWGGVGIWIYDATIPNATPFLLDNYPYDTRAVAYSPDGRYIATIVGAYDIYIWDIASRTIVKRLTFFAARQLGYNATGTILFIRGDNMFRFFSTETTSLLYESAWSEKSILDMAYHPDGNSIALTFESDTADVSLWTISDPNFGVGTEVTHSQQLPIPDGVIYSIGDLEFSPDGSRLLGSNYYNNGVIWDVASASVLQIYSNGLPNIDVNPVYETILTWCAWCDYTRILSFQGDALHELTIPKMVGATFSADGNTLLTLDSEDSLNTRVQHWDVNTGQLLQTRMGQDWYSVSDMYLSPDGEKVIVLSGNKIVVYSVNTGERLMTIQPNSNIYVFGYISMSPDGRLVAYSDHQSNLIFLDAQTGETMQQFTQDYGTMAFSPDSRRLLLGGETVRVWDIEAQAVIMTLGDNDNTIYQLAYSPDGRLIATVDGSLIRIFDAQTGVQLHVLQDHSDNITKVIFSPDSTQMVSNGWDGKTLIWDTTTYTSTQLTELDGFRFYKMAYSPDGQLLFVGWSVGPIFVLDAHTGAQLHELVGHRAELSGMTMTPDNTRLVTSSYDGTIRVWGLPQP